MRKGGMDMKKQKAGKGRGVFITCSILAVLLTFGLAMLCAKLILSGVLDENRGELYAGVITCIVSFILAMIIARHSPRRRLLWGTVTAAIYFLFLLMGNILFFGIRFSGVLQLGAWILGGGLLGSLLKGKKVGKYA